MRLLLDTHALLWWWKDDPRLSKRAAAAIADEANTVLVSAASAWEIATKHRIGKLPGADNALREFNELITADGFSQQQMMKLRDQRTRFVQHSRLSLRSID